MIGLGIIFGRISNTWALIGTSWDLVKKDKEMLVFPLVSGLCLVLVVLSFGLGMFDAESEGWGPPAKAAAVEEHVAYYAKLFVFYFCMYFVMMFFNTGIIACAVIRMRGGDPGLGDGFRVAFSRVPILLGWALVSATVGVLLRVIENQSEKVGRIVADLLGVAWSLVTFFTLPVLVVEGKGPIGAIKQSAKMLKDTWGEQVVAGYSFGLLWFVFCLPAFVVFAVVVVLGAGAYFWILTGLLVAYVVTLALVFSTMQTVFQAALYYYVRESKAPAGWDEDFLRGIVSAAG